MVAFMLELVQGEGGLSLIDADYLKECADYCKANGILLIFDEIQTAFCRTGKFFAYEHYNIEPDIMTLAKGIANGVPMGAMIAKKKRLPNTFRQGLTARHSAVISLHVRQRKLFLTSWTQTVSSKG